MNGYVEVVDEAGFNHRLLFEGDEVFGAENVAHTIPRDRPGDRELLTRRVIAEARAFSLRAAPRAGDPQHVPAVLARSRPEFTR